MLSREEAIQRHGATVDRMVKILTENCHRNVKLSREKKGSMCVLVENFNTMVRSGKDVNNRPIRLQEAVAGAGNGTGLSDVGPYTKFGINLITATMANTIADTLVSIQPMTSRVGEVRYLSYQYASNKGAVKKGDLVSNTFQFNGGNFEYSSDKVVGEKLANSSGTSALSLTLAWTPVRPGTVELVTADGKVVKDDGKGKIELASTTSAAGTIDYATGSITGLTFSTDPTSLTANYDYITTEPEPNVPEVTTKIDIMPMVAKSRKLKTAYSFDAAFDLQGDYGFNLDEETLAYFSAEIAHEIDGEIIEDLIRLAKSNKTTDGLKVEQIPEWDPVPPTGVNQMDHDDAFWNNIVKGGNIIFTRLRRGTASYVVAGVEVCNTIETMRKFVKAAGTDVTGPHITGTVNNVTIVKNPFMNPYEYIVGYLGASQFDTGYIYAPYMPVNVIDVIKDDGFTFGKGFVTAYGKASINAKCYVLGTVKKPVGA